MHVIILYDRWDPNDIDAVFGPFETREEAREYQKTNLVFDTYRTVSIWKLQMDLEDWMR